VHLDSLQGDIDNLWTQVEDLVASKKQKEYEEAIRKLIDLRDLSVRKGNQKEFGNKLDSLRERHLSKKAFQRVLEDKFSGVREL
jgi:hypothetical protein